VIWVKEFVVLPFPSEHEAVGAEMGGRSRSTVKAQGTERRAYAKETGIRTPSIRSEGMGKKRNKMDLFLLPGVPTDKDLEELADALLAGGRGESNERPKEIPL